MKHRFLDGSCWWIIVAQFWYLWTIDTCPDVYIYRYSWHVYIYIYTYILYIHVLCIHWCRLSGFVSESESALLITCFGPYTSVFMYKCVYVQVCLYTSVFIYNVYIIYCNTAKYLYELLMMVYLHWVLPVWTFRICTQVRLWVYEVSTKC